MRTDQLVDKLKSDLAKNPKKAAILALMCLVAVYFWAPLVTRWLSDDDSKADAAKAAQRAALAKTNSGKATEKTEEAAPLRGFEWRKLNQWIEADPLMTTATLADGQRDPFKIPEKFESNQRETQVVEDKRPTIADVDPNQLNLVLKSIFVAPRLRTATINGKTYNEQDMLKVKFGSQGVEHTLEYKIERIASKHVILGREGDHYVLPLAAVNLSSGSLTFGHRSERN